MKIGVSTGKRPGSLVLGGESPRHALAGFHVRLIERVDPENGTGHGGRDLPAKEFLAEVVRIVDPDAHDRVTDVSARRPPVLHRIGRRPQWR